MPDGKAALSGSAPSTAGVLVYVIGPSGAGKDTLISHVKDMPAGSLETRPLHIAGRRITRPAGDGAEKHYAMTEQEFARARRNGEFAMHWESHGLRYGISTEIDDWLAAGAVVIVNGSREYLSRARKIYPRLVPVLVRVDRDALRRRLLLRGRETPEEIERRIRRAALEVPDAPGLVVIDNSGALESALAEFAVLIKRLREDTVTESGRLAPSRTAA